MTVSPDDLLNSGETFRLVTRSDFDGLVCAAILKELKLIEEIKFVHPKDMQDGVIEITSNDITTNPRYPRGATQRKKARVGLFMAHSNGSSPSYCGTRSVLAHSDSAKRSTASASVVRPL